MKCVRHIAPGSACPSFPLDARSAGIWKCDGRRLGGFQEGPRERRRASMHMLPASKHAQRQHDIITTHHRCRHLDGQVRTRLAASPRLQILASYVCSMTCIMFCIPLRETTGKRPCVRDRIFLSVLFDSRYFTRCRPFSIPGASTP